jgi:hypothetical protein
MPIMFQIYHYALTSDQVARLAMKSAANHLTRSINH